MNSKASRRKVRKRKSPGQNSRVKFNWIIGIMLLAVFLGYLTARFVVDSLIGYDADESPAKIVKQGEEKDDVDDGNTEVTVNTAPTDGYALQFGAFSTREAAEKLAETLESQGIKTKIIEADSVFKVISPVVDTKQEVLNELEEVSEKKITEVFVAVFG